MLAAILSLFLSLPYQDAQQRFAIDLPNGWSASAADPGGVTFTRNRDGVLAICSVRITPLGQTSLDGYVKAMVGASQGQPGYKVIAQGNDKLAGVAAFRRRFVANIDPAGKLQKLADERVTASNGVAYLVHVETVAQAFESFVPEFSQLVHSFDFPRPQQQTAGASLPNYVLVGSWASQTDAASRLTFYADGRVLFGSFSGIYRIEGNQLVVQLTNREPQLFYWELVSGNLTLVSPSLAIPLRYRRILIAE
jgi:hypothetical protein